MGLYLVVFLAVQCVVGVILARLSFGRNRSPKKRSELSHRLAPVSQIEKFELRQRFIVSVRINFLPQCIPVVQASFHFLSAHHINWKTEGY